MYHPILPTSDGCVSCDVSRKQAFSHLKNREEKASNSLLFQLEKFHHLLKEYLELHLESRFSADQILKNLSTDLEDLFLTDLKRDQQYDSEQYRIKITNGSYEFNFKPLPPYKEIWSRTLHNSTN